MDRKQPNWHELMKLSPFAKPHFNENLKSQIIKKANQNEEETSLLDEAYFYSSFICV